MEHVDSILYSSRVYEPSTQYYLVPEPHLEMGMATANEVYYRQIH